MHSTVGWNNVDLQLTYDFDDGSLVDHNLYNFFENFAGGIEMPSHAMQGGGTTGWRNDEAIVDRGDSGGPNLIYDLTSGTWKVVAVNSYRYGTPPNILGYTGTPDFRTSIDSTFGEYGADAAVTTGLLQETLGLIPPSTPGVPFGTDSKGPFGPGGNVTP
ncbi:MAG: hypothetical protein DWQ36_24735 [Acidobacteria bacterium]|nr:MAG: hypothetical protein DWQ30_10775 [Acidobacteriota bacterium]REJ99546.1 MAG: hypothetical protein DWQ36_24735 [Acidobacteriota bacterium]